MATLGARCPTLPALGTEPRPKLGWSASRPRHTGSDGVSSDWTFLLGPGFIVGVGNGLILGYLMYRSGLVPRGMAMLGLIGGPLVCASGIGVLFGLFEPGSAPQALATAP